uniref:BHLH domain-containing protein n=2 Tax=Lutzomyia longipalpis TaxID=7200 RepID=A0A1B0EYM8_LUTLO
MLGMSMSFKLSSGESKKDRETIHSGQFMVSQFEAEAQEDWDDEEMPDPDKPNVVNTCTDIQRYVPRTSVFRNHELSIETSLTKLFNCMKLAYSERDFDWSSNDDRSLNNIDDLLFSTISQPFQFPDPREIVIMRKKTLCQFASPLDCDIHNKPEAVVLEGKYWKRDLLVISAEYKKWRRFHHHRTLEHSNALDTLSERDFDWSSNDDRSLNNIDDLLFSTISQPFQFPDPREIARGAGIADFIQPGLGPLQPNLEDFMDTCEPIGEFFGPSRLPPVLEEAPDDLFKSINLYIMGSEPMESVNMSEISGGGNQVQNNVPSVGGGNMLSGSAGVELKEEVYPSSQQLHYTAKMLSHDLSNLQQQQQQGQTFDGSGSNIQAYQKPPIGASIDQGNAGQTPATQYQQILSDKSAHGSYSKPSSRFSRNNLKQLSKREPHNYDKALPTPHQTNIYNQILIQQQEQQQQTLQSMIQMPQPSAFTGIQATNTFQGNTTMGAQQNMMQVPQHPQLPLPMAQNSQTLYNLLSQQPCTASFDQRSTSPTKVPYNQFKSMSVGFPGNQMVSTTVPMMNAQTPTATSNLIAISEPAPNSKEMYRSNSLPLNATLLFNNTGTKEATSQFVLPKYQPKSKAQPQQQVLSSTLQAATSEPALLQLLQQQATPSTTIGKQHGGSQTNLTSSTTAAPSTSRRHDTSPARMVGSESPSSALGLSPEIAMDQHEMGGPLSPSKDPSKYPQRRAGHIHAEQKRRYNIKNGFDVLQSLIPQLQQNPTAKLSKAAILQKGAEYIRQLKAERAAIHEKTEAMRGERDKLNSSLNHLHSILPANGAPVSRQRTGRVLELYNQYVRYRSVDNWKFWIFGLIFEPLLNSFNSTVSIASVDELCRTAMLWVDQNCSLVELRPAVTNKLRYLSTNTDILSAENPSTLREEVLKAISSQQLQARSSATMNSN